MDRQDRNQMTDEELARQEPDFIPGDMPDDSKQPAARPIVVGSEGTPESSSPEGEVSIGSEASRRP